MEDHVGWLLIPLASALLTAASLAAWLRAVDDDPASIEWATLATLTALAAVVSGGLGLRSVGRLRVLALASVVGGALLCATLALPATELLLRSFRSGTPDRQIGGPGAAASRP